MLSLLFMLSAFCFVAWYVTHKEIIRLKKFEKLFQPCNRFWICWKETKMMMTDMFGFVVVISVNREELKAEVNEHVLFNFSNSRKWKLTWWWKSSLLVLSVIRILRQTWLSEIMLDYLQGVQPKFEEDTDQQHTVPKVHFLPIYIYISGPLILSSCGKQMHGQTIEPRRLRFGM